ncbi:MAG: DUF6605 domain-containing protein [Hyphomicrobiaceae bacterium]
MLKLAGYADRLSVRPGETIRFHVASETGAPVASRVVRVACADPNPAVGGVRVENAGTKVREVATPAPRSVPRGSYGVVSGAPIAAIDISRGLTLAARICRARGSVISLISAGSSTGIGFGVDEGGHLNATVAVTGALPRVPLTLGTPQDGDRWYLVWLAIDSGTGRARLGQQPLALGKPAGEAAIADVPASLDAGFAVAALLIGAAAEHEDPFRLDGRIEQPMIFDRALSEAEIMRAAAGKSVDGLVACWDFSKEIPTDRIVDVGPHGLHGRLVNSPARGMTGSNWTGREMCWRHAPSEYAAIHFHSDDVDDCRWPITHELTIPADTASGQYALMLDSGGETDNVPFFVVPPKGKPTAKLAVLVSTFTYTVYGNHARPEWQMDPRWQAAWRAQAKEWNSYPHNPGDHIEYGLSTYNYHPDGSGISLASWHRPMLNVRVGYFTYPYPEIRGSGQRHYPGDTHLTAWLEAKGIAYDIITDWELHHEGIDILKDYQVVTTGTHPEYHTREMLDALESYKEQGGRFMYLGGNGFYWKIALNPAKPGQIEIRRGEGGIRAWAAEPGEYYNQLDGEYGGLWRRNGRPPQHLTGVGFTAQGNFVGSHYRVHEDARASRAAWILAGVEGDILGAHGFSGHGAAGFELDRADKKLGTPPHAVILASSEDHPPEAPWILVPEERLTHLVTLPGEPEPELIRADLVFFETAGGKGAVFSTGSITWCGSLPTNGFDNDVSRVTGNVLRRFLDPAPFAD